MEGYDKYESYETRDKLSSSFYENYDSHDELNPYQMLNQMKSWNKAIYLTVEDLDSRTSASLTIMNDRITSEVQDLNDGLVSYINQTAGAITAEVSDFKNQTQAQFQVQAGQISSKVASADYNGNTIASLINQTATTVAIQASKINLNGYVTVSSLGYGGTTQIYGGNIQTGTITATQIAGSTITAYEIAGNTITSSEIASNAITSSEISSGAIYAGAIQSDAIQSYHISAGAITAGKIQSYAIESYHISAGAISANMITTGYLSADRIYGGTLSGVDIYATNNVTLGNAVYLGPSGLYYIDISGGDFEIATWGDATVNGATIITSANIGDYI